MRRTTPTPIRTTKPTNKLAQQIYLRRANVATRIVAKCASADTVPTNLIFGSGLKPLTNKAQQPLTAPAASKPAGGGASPSAAPTPAVPQQPKVDPFPTSVSPPPVPAPAPQSLAPGTNMATGKPITPGTSVIAPTTESSQTEIATLQSPAVGNLVPAGMPIADTQNMGDSEQMHIAQPENAHSPITPPAAVNPTDQPGGQPAGQPADQTQQNTGNQAQPAGPPRGQPAGQPTDPDQFAQDLQKMPKEQAVSRAKEYVQSELAKPENQEIMRGMEDIKSGDQQRANSPAAQAYQAAMKKAPEGFIREEYERLIKANPNATPAQQGGFMSQAINNGMARFQEAPQGAQIMMGLGLSVGLIGALSSLFGEGGMGGGLMGLLGLGGAGLMAANYGMFGDDARQMVGQGAIGLGRMMGMNIPGKDDFTPDGMAKRQQQVGADVQGAMNTKNDKGQRGGWAAGQQKLDQTRQPLDYLASMDEGSAITALMGAMETNDPSVAKQQYDMLIKKRQEMSDPEFLRNQARGQMLENLPYVGDQRETVESRPVLKSLANQALNYVGYGAYPTGKK